MVTGGRADAVEPFPFGSPKHLQQFAAARCNRESGTVSVFTIRTKHTTVADTKPYPEIAGRHAVFINGRTVDM